MDENCNQFQRNPLREKHPGLTDVDAEIVEAHFKLECVHVCVCDKQISVRREGIVRLQDVSKEQVTRDFLQ